MSGVVVAGLVFGILLLAMCMLPALGTSRGAASPADRVDVVRRELVGSYETAVLVTPDAAALLSWLESNQFQVPDSSSMAATVSQYIKDGWRFVAVRLRREESETALMKPHPLAFTFKTSKAVYPLRLTAVGFPADQKLTVDLFVYGNERAAIDGWKVKRCVNSREDGKLADTRHEGIGHLRGTLPVLTHLHARLSPQQMQQDAAVSWTGFSEKKPRVYTPSAALLLVLTVVSAVLFVLALDSSRLVTNPQAVRWRLNVRGILLVTAIGSVIAFVLMPRTSQPEMVRSQWHGRSGPDEMRQAYRDRYNAGRPVTMEIMAQMLPKSVSPEKIGDGPGQYFLRIRQDYPERTIQLVHVNSLGEEVVAETYGPERTGEKQPSTDGPAVPATGPGESASSREIENP